MTDCEDTPAFRKPYEGVYKNSREHLDQWAVEDLLDPLLGGVYWEDAKLKGDHRTGFLDEYKKRYRFWQHRSVANLPEDLSALVLLDRDIMNGVSSYIDKPEVHTKYLDWYCADILTYGAWFRLFEEAQWLLVGMSGAIANKAGGAWPFIAAAWRFIWLLLKWAVWLVVLVVIHEALGEYGLLGAGIWIALTALRQFQRWKARRKIAEILNSMRAVYETLQSQAFSWEVLWRELNRTRELGAIWPGELYKLAE